MTRIGLFKLVLCRPGINQFQLCHLVLARGPAWIGLMEDAMKPDDSAADAGFKRLRTDRIDQLNPRPQALTDNRSASICFKAPLQSLVLCEEWSVASGNTNCIGHCSAGAWRLPAREPSRTESSASAGRALREDRQQKNPAKRQGIFRRIQVVAMGGLEPPTLAL